MPRNDREVFTFLRAEPDSALEVDFLAYALYAFEKYQWYEQFERDNARPPEQEDVDRWVADITNIRFQNMREQAARLFDSSAHDYLAEFIELQKQEAVRSSILAEVKAASAFWKQLVTALITAILAPLIIGGVIAAALTYDRLMPTATDISKHAGDQQTAPAKSHQ